MNPRKYASTPKPFVSMTDMLVSLNAGLLVLGIMSAVDPDLSAGWLSVQREVVRVEQEAASLRSRTQDLQRRYQALSEATKHPEDPASGGRGEPPTGPKRASGNTVAAN